ncbi:MAG: LysM peptidoglycan-binding domain-containing protein [Akkermansiaceae bacterium]|nr:LysM peptidoglycan-binding domain-containing protein [Akkermansiaceae bacterium]MCP5548564.1 LysM peptidoglycan-binding domain-containing protein [Akkermansiaceae bacterium]
MKASLLLGTLTLWAATVPTMGRSELEQLRERCAAQEAQIQKLQAELGKGQAKTPASASEKSVKESTSGEFSTYTVKKGDSLERIANRLKSTPESIARINRLKLSSVIHPGQKLQVPAGGSASAPARSRATAETYRIREGDTYFSISRRHGIPVDSLMAANPNVKATSMRPGQTIRLASAPATSPKPAAAPAPSKPEAPAMAATPKTEEPKTAPQETPAPAPAESKASEAMANHPSPASAEPAPSPSTAEPTIQPVMINGEMTYGEFASQHGTDIDRLNDLNGLDLTSATVLARGSELYVPAQP